MRWEGGRLEVSPELCERAVELRYEPNAPEALPKVFVEGRFVCDTVPLDLYRNAQRKRRRDLGAPESSGEGPAPQGALLPRSRPPGGVGGVDRPRGRLPQHRPHGADGRPERGGGSAGGRGSAAPFGRAKPLLVFCRHVELIPCALMSLSILPSQLPDDRPVALLMRHAERPPIPEGSMGMDLLITEAGLSSLIRFPFSSEAKAMGNT